jgi:uncharacterized membrane protein YdbT with pleckstrin-like domain
MSYVKKTLIDGEVIKKQFNLHWNVWIAVVVSALGCLVFLVFGLTAMPNAKFIFYVLGLVFAVSAFRSWLNIVAVEQAITNHRVVYKKGLISRYTEEMRNEAVETVEVKQSIFGRIFGSGDVVVTGRGISKVKFRGVDDPLSVKRDIDTVLRGDR